MLEQSSHEEVLEVAVWSNPRPGHLESKSVRKSHGEIHMKRRGNRVYISYITEISIVGSYQQKNIFSTKVQ